MERCLGKKQHVFAIDVCKILDESKPGCNEPINFEDFLTNYQDIFLDELSGMPPQREVDHAIELVARVTPIAKASYRHSFKDNL